MNFDESDLSDVGRVHFEDTRVVWPDAEWIAQPKENITLLIRKNEAPLEVIQGATVEVVA